MKKSFVISIIIVVSAFCFLLLSYSSLKKVGSNGLKVEVLNNKKEKELKYVSELILLYENDLDKFKKLYLNSKMVITDSISKIDVNYIDNDSSYSTSYDVISLDNDVKLFIGHGQYENIEDLSVGDKVTIESKIISCDKICILRDIKYLDDAGFKYIDKSLIRKIG